MGFMSLYFVAVVVVVVVVGGGSGLACEPHAPNTVGWGPGEGRTRLKMAFEETQEVEQRGVIGHPFEVEQSRQRNPAWCGLAPTARARLRCNRHGVVAHASLDLTSMGMLDQWAWASPTMEIYYVLC